MTNPAYPPPPPPYNYGAPPVAAPAPPGTVKGAFLVYMIAALLAAVGIVLALTSPVWDQAIAASLNNSSANTSGISASSLVNTAKIITVVAGVIFLGLYLLFAFKMRAGRNWARIVLTVLSALSILSASSASAKVTVNNQTFQSSSTQLSGWIGAALAIVAIVLMFLPASNAYFAASKAARQQGLR